MNEAVDLVLKANYSVRAAANEMGLAHKTLGRYDSLVRALMIILRELSIFDDYYQFRYVEKRKNTPNDLLQVGYSTHRRVFNDEHELDLCNYIKFRAKMCYGLTRKDARKAAYTFAECLEVSQLVGN